MVPSHGRCHCAGITERADHAWSGVRRLAVDPAINLEHVTFGEGLGAG
jgi:hypothetical protein